MKIGIVQAGSAGVDYHRILKPFSLLDYDITRCEGINSEVFDHNFDVLVFSRLLPIVKQQDFIKELKKRGTYVICDIDDHWILNTAHVAKKAAEYHKRQSIEALMYSDEIWVTHEHLGKEVDRLNQNWHVIPNAIDPDEPQWQPKTDYQNRIGWAGGVTHFQDLMLTDGCYSQSPVIAGYCQGDPEWKRLADNFTAVYVEALDVWNYGHLYEQFDIAIAPLVDNKFNTYKSNLKIIEAGMKGLPIFVQNIHPYIDATKGIFKVNDWREGINTAEQMSVGEIQENGLLLRKYVVDNYNIHDINEKRKERLE